MVMQDSFANLGSTFDVQQQQNQLAQLMTAEQFKQLQDLNDPSTNLALARQSAAAQGNYPRLTTQIEAKGVGEGVMKGIAAGIGNAQQLGAYNRQNKAIQEVGNIYNQAQQRQRELVEGQIRADQIRRQGAAGVLPEKLRPIYGVLDPTGQNTLLGNAATKEVGVAYAPIEGTAEGQAQVNKGQTINNAIQAMPPVEVGGVPIPAQVDARHNIQGFAPTTTVGVNKDILANQGALIQNRAEANKLQVQPQQLQQQIQKDALDIQIKQVESQFAEQEKILAIKRDQLANQKGTLDYKKAMDDYKRFEKGQSLFKSLQSSGALNTQDPNKQAEIQAQLGIMGVKWNPPNAKYSTIKHKNGTVYQVDNTNNMVRELLDKGGKVNYGPWQELGQ